MSDPRQEERLRPVDRAQRSSLVPTQLAERIKRGLSPVDDDLPFAQAVRQQEDMLKACKAFHAREKRRSE